MAYSADMIRKLTRQPVLDSGGLTVNDRMVKADDALRAKDFPKFTKHASLLMKVHGWKPEQMDKQEFMAHYLSLAEDYHFRDYEPRVPR
jgi:hypothetical protein